MSNNFALRGHSTVIKKLHFLSSDALLSVEKEGQIIVWDLNNQKIKHYGN